MGRQPRQRPISCQFCRMRKLRCSRIFPCSNCTSRGVTCVQTAGPSGRSMSQVKDLPANTYDAAQGFRAGSVESPEQSSQAGGGQMTSEILMRLDKLESMITNQNALLERRSIPAPGPALPPTQPEVFASTSKDNFKQAPIPPKLQGLTDDAMWIEKAGGSNMLRESLQTDNVVFRPCQVRLITKQPFWIYSNPPVSPGYENQGPTKCIWLPRREEAHVILHKYVSDITHFHHVVHIPSLRLIVDEVYNNLDQQEQINLGSVILMFAVIASATYSWIPRDDVNCLFANAAEANAQTVLWIRAALDVINLAERQGHASIDCCQGLVILFFVLCNLEGISQRARALVHKSIVMAKEMSLHRTDSPLPIDRANVEGMSEARREIRRRLWWYLTSTDWMLGQFANLQEGTYTINPNQIACNRPRNTNDEDLLEGKEVIERPKDEPTNVSYFLQRLRLATICRENLDRTPLAHIPSDSLQYRNILDVDSRLNHLVSDLPAFMSLDQNRWMRYPVDSLARSPGITIQRYIFNLVINRQLCKMHLPYLPRGTVERSFAYSRETCIRSAKIIVQIFQDLQREILPFVSSRQRTTMVLRSMFLANIVLVLDACLKDDSVTADTPGSSGGGSADESKDMLVAWQLFTEARPYSAAAPKVLELSMEVLRKHKPDHPALKTMEMQKASASYVQAGSLPLTPESAQNKGMGSVSGDEAMRPPGDPRARGNMNANMNSDMNMGMGMLSSLNGVTDPAVLQQQWASMDGSRADVEAIDWDRIVWGLDAPFI